MKYLILVAPLLLTGCVTGAFIAPAVDEYCESFTVLEQTVFRARMDENTYPHEVRINCYAISNEFGNNQSEQQPVETIEATDL